MTKTKKTFGVVAILATFLATILFVQDYWYFYSFDRQFPWLKNIIYFYFHIPFWLAVYPLINWLTEKYPLDEFRFQNYLFLIISLYMLAVVKFVIHYGLTNFIQNQFDVGSGQSINLFKAFYLASSLPEFFIYLFAVVFISLYKMIENYRSEREENLVLQNQLSLAEIDTLKMQMQPHFLFNTLNSLSSLVEEKSADADAMIIHLADFLRYSLDYKDQNFVTVEAELDFCRHYLEIERLRFKDRLQVIYTIDDDVLQENVPTFLLQPLLENAIKHGLSKQAKNETIELSIQKSNNQIELTVSNSANSNGEIHYGNGLSNLENRLKQLYNDRYQMIIQHENGKFQIQINLEQPNGIH